MYINKYIKSNKVALVQKNVNKTHINDKNIFFLLSVRSRHLGPLPFCEFSIKKPVSKINNINLNLQYSDLK